MVSAPYRFCVLVPADNARPLGGFSVSVDEKYQGLLSATQRLRGRIYLSDGAISAQKLDSQGRLCLPDEDRCWHLLLIDNSEQVIGCVRYRLYPGTVSYAALRVRQSALAQSDQYASKVKQAVEQELLRAQRDELSFVEIGGWALDQQWRHTQAAVQLLAASYALGEIWGGCIGIATATFRHRSASMLKRLGGTNLRLGGEDLPPYKDAQYGCFMELLRFDRMPNARFIPLVREVLGQLFQCQAICRPPAALPAAA